MTKWIRLATACGIACAADVAVAARTVENVTLLPSPLELPRRIGPLTLTGEPHKYQDPALGVSYQYGGDGLSLTVYVFDAGDTDIPDGADTMGTCREFEIAKQGVTQAYQNTRLKSEQLVRLSPPADAPLAREAWYEFEREQRPMISFIWITAVSKYFVKLRFSIDPRLSDELPEARRAVLSMLGESIKPHLKPADSNAETPGASINLQANGDSADALEVGVAYLALLAAVADQAPAQAPVCGGEFVPDFETELGVFRGMIALDAGAAGTRLGKRIAQIEKAGFLEEFIWRDRHREAWGTQVPQGLDLSGYQAWRKKHLRRFRAPDFGTVTLSRPRPLPVEPAAP